MDDPRTELITCLDTRFLSIKGFTPFIFLCGGLVGNNPKLPLSLRESLYHHLMVKDGGLFSRIRTAEDITDWFRDGIYSDLIVFEKHLAGLSSLIVLIVESPGAIAELGAFSQVPEIAKRLHVVIKEKHYDKDSFIKLGPIAYLENNFPNRVHVYPWNEKSNSNNFDIDISDVHRDIVDSLNSIPNEQKFNSSSDGHRMLFVCDILDLMLALKLSEVGEYLSLKNIILTEDELKRYLFVLDKLNLIQKISYGNDRYYISKSNTYLANHRYENAKYSKRDRMSLKGLVRDYYTDKDIRRLKAIKKHIDTNDEGIPS